MLLHGGMKPAEKAAAVASFRDGTTPIMICTVVVEVRLHSKSAIQSCNQLLYFVTRLAYCLSGSAVYHGPFSAAGHAAHITCWWAVDMSPYM